MGRAARLRDQRASLAALKAKQRRGERRRAFWIYGTAAVILIAVVAVVTSVFILNGQNTSATIAATNKPIAGVKTFTGLTRNHTSAEVSYPQIPPVGGDHAPIWINCGVYTHPINNWEAVHSLEHGAVWVTYRPDLPQSQIDTLAQQAATHPYELLSPYPGLPSPVVASAWGKQLKMDSASDPRLPVFLQAYLQGKQTPEPGAACSGGAVG